MLDLWDEKQLFDKAVIQRLRYGISQGPSRHASTYDHHHQTHQNTTHHAALTPPPPPPKQYYELPAGLMAVALKVCFLAFTILDGRALKYSFVDRPATLYTYRPNCHPGKTITSSTQPTVSRHAKCSRWLLYGAQPRSSPHLLLC